jgi:hypothetical protein
MSPLPTHAGLELHDSRRDMCDSCQRWIIVDDNDDNSDKGNGGGKDSTGSPAHDRETV